MKTQFKKLTVLFVALVVMVPAFGEEFYVAPDGNDANPGTITEPWATLAGARDNVRPYLDGNGDITVYFRGGTYTFEQTVVFGLSDDGTANQSITYTAYPSETPIFGSLEQVTGWTTYSGNIMQADLPTGITHVRYLQDASENWMSRSAGAMFNPGERSSSNEALMYEPDGQEGKTRTEYPRRDWTPPDWTDASQYDLRISTEAWTVNILPVSSVDSGSRLIYVATPATYQMKNCTRDCASTEGWVLNTLEGIDTAGEWACLNGTIYLYPDSGTGDIYVPRITEFIRVDEGTANGNQAITTPVQYINFEGITFTGGDFYMRYYDYNNPLNSDVTSQHDWGIVDRPAGMLRFRNAANCTVDGCTFTKSGAGGVRLDRYAQNITVTNCEFSYLGREAVSLMGRGIGYGDVSKNNEISYNNMIATGREKWDAPVINLSQSSNNLIHHNYIEDTHFSAIIFTSSRGVYLAYKCYEGSDSYFIGAECHYWECHPDAVAMSCDAETWGYERAKVECHQYMYNYNNVFEKNVITDASNGGQFFANFSTPTNGMIYTSGGKRNETNWLELNYVYDAAPLPNTQVLYADTYMDNLEVLKNMFYNVQIGEVETPTEFYEGFNVLEVFCNWQDWDVNYGGRGLVRSNAIKNSYFFEFIIGMFTQEEGNIDFDSGSPGGDPANVTDYEEMYLTLCPGNLPGPSPLPGATSMQSSLASKITEFGGTVPSCGPPDTDPPTPDPMTWAQDPCAISESAISMTATTASDPSGVEYYFANLTDPNHDSGWQAETTYVDTGLQPSTEYCYQVKARDKSANQNETAWSTTKCATTETAPPALPWSDGFESGDFAYGGWTTQNEDATVSDRAEYSGVYGAKLAGTTWIEKAISTAGFTNIHVKYYRKTKGLDTGEYLYVEWYDGNNWNELESTQDTDWGTQKDMTCGTGADDNANFKVRFRTNASSGAEYAYIDDVGITGTAM